MTDSTLIPIFRASSAAIGGSEALELFRGSVRDIFEVAPAEALAPEDFQLEMVATHLGRVLLSEVRASALTFDRDPRLVAFAGIDHLLVQLYTAGGFSGMADGRRVEVRAGDICIFDLSRTLHTRAVDFANITLVLPSFLLAEVMDGVDRLHGVVLARDEPLTRILGAHFRTLVDQAEALSPAEADIVGRSTIALIGRMIEGHARGDQPARVEVTPLRRVLDHIDANLQDPELGPAQLIEQFGLSRTRLYRMFEGAGGVAEVIRLRRLNGAAIELASATAQERRISDIARRWGFADDSSFGRAFRTHYGITPTEARTRSGEIWNRIQTWRTEMMAGDEGAEISYWLRTLRR